MRLFIILFLLLLFILFVPIKLKAKVNYDILNNYGFVSIYFYKLKVFLCKISFVPFKILIETKRKRFKFKIFKKEKDYSYGEIFFKEVMKRLRINNLRLTSRFGLFQDCLLSSIGSGSILALSSILMFTLSSEKNIEHGKIMVFPDYMHSRMLFCFSGSVRLNIFLIILSLVVSLFKTIKRGVKKYGNEKTC